MVERYAHLMPSSMGPQIKRVWGGQHPRFCPARLDSFIDGVAGKRLTYKALTQ